MIFTHDGTFKVCKTKNIKQRETLGETCEMHKEAGETLCETLGNITGNGGKHVGNCH